MKKKLFGFALVCFLICLSLDTYAQEPKIIQYKVRIWLARGYTTVTIGTLNVYISGLQYNIPTGNNSNNYMFYDNKGASGALPVGSSITVVGNYSCWSQSTGTKNFTVNATVPNTQGCGGTYSGSNQGVDFHVDFIPVQIPTPAFLNTPGCLDEDIIWPIINLNNNPAPGNGSSGSTSYALQIGIFDPGGGSPTNIRTVSYNTVGWQQPPITQNVAVNLQTYLGANASQYIGKQVVFQSWREGTSTPCAGYFDKIYSDWTAPYIIYPPGPKLNGSITSLPPFCSMKPNTASITIPPITGAASNYVYTINKLVPVVTGTECAANLQIDYNSKKYCPGTSTINRVRSGTDTVKIVNLASGVYQVTIENQGVANPCARSVVYEVGPPAPFTATASPNTPDANGNHIKCFGGNSGQITFNVSTGTAPYTFTINGADKVPDISSPPTFTNLAANTYTLKVKDSNGCDTDAPIANIELKQIPAAEAFSAEFVDLHEPTCFGGSNGTASLNVKFGTAPFTYLVNAAAATPTGPDRSPLLGAFSAATAYTIRITDANSCQTQLAPFTLTQPADIAFTRVDKVDLTCNGVSTGSLKVIGASGGTAPLNYSINNGTSYVADPEFKTLAAGTYIVKIQDKNFCVKNVSTEVVSQPAAITFSTIGHVPQSCPEIPDGVISFAPSSGGTGAKMYSMNDVTYIPETALIQFAGLDSKSYTLYTKDAEGCKVTASYFLPVKAAITGTIAVSHPISCFGDTDGSLNLTPGGGTAPYTFKWSTNETTEDITSLADNLYTVEITDSKGCIKSFTRDLQQPDVLNLQQTVLNHTGFGVSCWGSSDGSIDLTVLGGTGPFVYAWSTASTLQDVSGLSAGEYDVHVTDAHNCQASLVKIKITEPTAVALSLSTFKNIACKSGSDGQLTALAQGGVGLYEYSINGTTWQDEALFNGLTAQAYTVHMRDGNGCVSNTFDHTLTEPPLLELSMTKKIDTSCGAANGSAEVLAQGGAGSYQYNWYDASNATIGTGNTMADLASGDYHATTKDVNGCTTTLAIIINDSDGPKITQEVLKGLTCFQSNDGEIGISLAEGLPPYTIQWDTHQSTTSITNVTGGEHWVEVLDTKGCRGKRVFQVPFPPALAVANTNTIPLCTGNTNGGISIVASGGNPGGYTYAWSTGSTGTSLTNIPAGTYQITITDTKSCKLVKDIVLPDAPAFIVDAGGDRTICVGQKLSIKAQEDNATYFWTSDAGYTSTDREVVLTIPAKYTLKVVTQNGCIDDDSFVLATSNDLLNADFLMAAEAHAGDTIVLVEISWPMPGNIEWEFPEAGDVISSEDNIAEVLFAEPGEYNVVLTAHLGECIDTFTKTIRILEGQSGEGGRQASDFLTRFEIFPNPNNGIFSWRIEFSEKVAGRMRMFSTLGNSTLINRSLEDNAKFEFEESFQNIPSGLYVLIIEVNGRSFSKRIVVE